MDYQAIVIYLDESRREEAIDAAWEAYKEQLPGLESVHRELAKQWGVVAICANDSVIGALFHKDDILHIGIIPAWHGKWASRRIIKEMLTYGSKTEVFMQHRDFVERIGFVENGDIYEMVKK